MKTSKWILLKMLISLFLLIQVFHSQGTAIKFVVMVYDIVTYDPVAGKAVDMHILQAGMPQPLYQQGYITNSNGEIITPGILLQDSMWYGYSFSMVDCNQDTVDFYDSLLVNNNDTLFLFLGVCHAVSPSACMARFTYTMDTLNPFLVNFTNTSTGTPSDFLWNFGDGTTSTLQHPQKQYNSPGAYLVCLTISDSGSLCQNTWCNVVTMTQGVVIQAAFSHQLDSFSVMPRIVSFYNETQSNIPINQYVWSFGDGTGALMSDPVHQFQQSGTYQVCLRSGVSGGLYDTVCMQITIPEYHNLWGQVFSGSTTMLSGSVQLLNPLQTDVPLLDEITVGSYGLYFFAQRIEHNYLLRVLPDQNDPLSADFLPTYSGNTLFWKEAHEVILNGDISNYDLHLVRKKSISPGTCSVDGMVLSTVGSAMTNVLVMLLNTADQAPVVFTYSDSSGFFMLDKIPYGSYWLVAEDPGYESNLIQVVFNPLAQVFSSQIIWLSQITGISTQMKDISFSLYPNPTDRQITVTIPWTGTLTDFLIHTTDGKQVMQQRIWSGAPNQVTLDVSTLPAGVYVATAISEYGTIRKKFIRAGGY